MRKLRCLYWKSVFYLLFMLVFKYNVVSIVKQKKKKYSVLTIFLSTFVGENNN